MTQGQLSFVISITRPGKFPSGTDLSLCKEETDRKLGGFMVYKWSYSYLLCVYLGRDSANWSWSYLYSAAASQVLFALAVTGSIPPIDRFIMPSWRKYLSDTYIILLW